VAKTVKFKPGDFRKIDSRLVLLVGQSLSLGILLSLLIITASALFLTRFGSQNLPYVYIAVAILGSAVFYGYAELQRRFSLPSLSKATLIVIASYFLLSWVGLRFSQAGWLSFLLMGSFSLIIQMGFVLLGNQAGRLFDVREMKAKFPRVVAGFAIGFLLGGFIAAQLAGVFGRAEDLLILAVFFSLTMLAFLVVTDRRYHIDLVHVEVSTNKKSSKPLWQLLAKRFVLLVVLYQMLSAMASQLFDFMLFDQAASRYAESLGLAEFLGNYTVVVNVSDILFLSLFAGLLLSRFGLKFGMGANPIIDVLILAVEVTAGILLGVNSSLFFTLVMTARIVDITLTDGTTRGSVNTAYQALPAEERVTVQTGVEGIGVPVALGLTGVVLLAFNAISGVTSLHVAIFTLVVSVIWTASALLAYRGYASALIQSLRRRALNPAELTLEDSSSMAVIQGFLANDNIREIRLALDLLQDARHKSLSDTLISLTDHHDVLVRMEVMSRIEHLKITEALPAIEGRLALEDEPRAKSATLLAYCALKLESAVEFGKQYLENSDPLIQHGACVGLLRYGGLPGFEAANQQLTTLTRSADPLERKLAAQIIGDIESLDYYQPLRSLLDDESVEVRRAALIAAGQVGHPELISQVIKNLDQPAVRSAAMSALTNFGEAIFSHVENALSGIPGSNDNQTIRLIHVAYQIGGEGGISLLRNHVSGSQAEVRSALLHSLSLLGYQASKEQEPGIEVALQEEVRDAVRLLTVYEELDTSESTRPLKRALSDELENVRQRIVYLLTFLGDRAAILRASERLRSGSSAQKSLALETLDVMLRSGIKKFVLPLVDSRLTHEQQLKQLDNIDAVPEKEQDARLAEIITGDEGTWRHSWLRSCAIYAAADLGYSHLAPVIESALSAPESTLRETAIWALHRLDRKRFEDNIAVLLTDPDLKVASLSKALIARDV